MFTLTSDGQNREPFLTTCTKLISALNCYVESVKNMGEHEISNDCTVNLVLGMINLEGIK